ncbi:MAG: hypothetical protein C0404_05280 [Verrucomicrobia bacterium]|nr:hypothetical protein [Verrucomicrobiota bacterium]
MSHDSLRVDTAGRRISDLVLQRGMSINIIAGCLGTAWWAMTQGMPLTMLLEALGASGTVMGLATTILQLALVAQIPGALLSSRMSTRKAFWGPTALFHRILWFIPPLLLMLMPNAPQKVAWAMIWLIAVSGVLAQSTTALWFSWMADLVPRNMLGRFWGYRQTWTMVFFLAAMGLGGWLLDAFPAPRGGQGGSWMGFILVFAIGAVLGCVDIIIHLWVPEPKAAERSEDSDWLERIVEPLKNADFRRLTIAMGILTFALGLSSLGGVYMKKDFGITYTHLSVMAIASSLGTLAFGFIWGYVLDRIGGRAFGAMMMVLGPLVMACWFFVKDYGVDFVTLCGGVPVLGHAVRAAEELLPAAWREWVHLQQLPQSVWIVTLASFGTGAIFGGLGLCQVNMSSALASEKNRTMSMAVHWSVVGLIGAGGALFAGKVMDYIIASPFNYTLPTGTIVTYQQVLVVLQTLIIWFIALPVFLRIRRRKGEPHLATAFSQILITSPFKVVTSIYMMTAYVTSHRRAVAARHLGLKRSVIAVPDLIEKLDDASAEVREESAYALGRIGSPEAVAALVAKLKDSNSDLGPQAARGLRMSRDPEAVSALIAKLDDPDRELKTECIRALGEIGDERSVKPILNLLVKSTDTKIIGAAAEALAKLHEMDAVYEIIPRMRETRNIVLDRSLAVSVGDLLGQPDEFYKVLTRELRTRGSEVARLCKDLVREIRTATKKTSQAEGRGLVEAAREVERLYDEEKLAECAEVMFKIGVGMTRICRGLAADEKVESFISAATSKDPRIGVGIWYLDLLRKDWEARDSADILLGLYFLSHCGPRP